MAGIMADNNNPFLDALKASALVFVSLIFMIVLLALYVNNTIKYSATISAEETAKNLTPPGKVYTRQTP